MMLAGNSAELSKPTADDLQGTGDNAWVQAYMQPYVPAPGSNGQRSMQEAFVLVDLPAG